MFTAIGYIFHWRANGCLHVMTPHLLPESTLLALVFSDAYTWLAAKLRNPILDDDQAGFPGQDRLDHDEALLVGGDVIETAAGQD